MKNFEWVSRKKVDEIATIYETNITLNKSATTYLEKAFIVLLGLDKERHLIAIKPIRKGQTELEYIPKEQRHNITIKSSYSRISNKRFIEEISQLIKLNFEKQNYYKFGAYWSDSEQALIIDLNKGEM
ncbi:MAG: hypothetical protein K9L64_02265 [Candidatus Izimaplasma sp.]|nr:hypothetical protein [Candidatus Izimaplasma bacterium]